MGKQVRLMKLVSVALCAVAFAGSVACSKSDSPPNASTGNAGSAGSNGTGGSTTNGGGSNAGSGGGATAGKPSTGPAISEAPPAWVAQADCGGVGDTCPEGIFGCTAPTSTCQLEGYVCIPAFEGSLPKKSEETPYCAAFTCMTFEQASCFCLGDAGKGFSGCVSPSALAGLCGTDNKACDAEADCCDGFACLPQAYYPSKSCRQKCETNEDCGTGCCTDALDTGTKICAPAAKCETACKKQGETDCSLNDPNKPTLCCRGTCVMSENSNYAGCRPRCSKNEDCFDTGCCRYFKDSTTDGFCVDAKFCSCGAAGTACGSDDDAPCCTGTTCLSYGDAPFACYSDCTTHADCPGACCVTLSDGVSKACSPPRDSCPAE